LLFSSTEAQLRGFSKLPPHDRMSQRTPFEIPPQCRREGFRARNHRLALCSGPGRQCFPLTNLLSASI